MIGPGKYDDECTAVRLSTQAMGVVMIVVGGNRGSGFSTQFAHNIEPSMLAGALRQCAASIERDAGIETASE